MPPRIRPGVPKPVAKHPDLGWELALVTDGPDVWAVIWDGATPHEGPVRRDRTEAEADLKHMLDGMIAWANLTKAHAAASAGMN